MTKRTGVFKQPPIRNGGFTLVELLVGSFLGILLLFGVLQIFNSSREGARLQNAMAAVQDSGRIGMEFLSRDIRNADFSGCLIERPNLVNGINTASSGYDARVHEFYSISMGPLHGYEVDSAVDPVDFGGHNPVSGSSVLTVVSARPFCEGVTSVGVNQAAADQALATADNCVIPDGSPVLVASCDSADIFVKTGGIDPTIEHSASEVNGLANASNAFSTLYGTDAEVFQPVVLTYFLAPGQNGRNALFRIENGTVFEIITNVEDFQVTFGVDSGSGVADVFIDPITKTEVDNDIAGFAGDMGSVVSVRVELQIASDQLVDGTPLRRTYTATTNVRNRMNQS